MTSPPARPPLARRQLLRSAVLLFPLVALPGLVRAAVPARQIAFNHTHTGETLDVTYCENGVYVPEALAEINRICRDFRTGDVHPIDPALLDLLDDLRRATGRHGHFEIISAFRSPQTNRMLAQSGGGVSSRSLHLRGQAIDVRLPGVSTADLRQAALRRGAGGVGYYPQSDFVHLDTGRVRRW